MSKKMLNALENATNFTLTENAAVARKTTGSDLLNFFSVAGALRTRSEQDIVRLFDIAFCENPTYALKALFYFRDIRGGQGERRTFRTILKYLASAPETREWLKKNLILIPEYGRWDDLFVLLGTNVEEAVLQFVYNQLRSDSNGYSTSLLAKWMPSENASSQESKLFAKKFMKFFGFTPRQYRKVLVQNRKRIDILESKLSANQWGKVDYEHVPSQANLLYRKAFSRHDGDRYASYLESVKKGEKKMNAGVLYPYDIIRKCLFTRDAVPEALDAMWKSLPDYMEGSTENSIVVADVSGSMCSNNYLPICTSISLAIYAAERNKGVFHNKFITFSGKPELQTVKGSNIVQKAFNLNGASWEMNTNVEAVFDLLLRTAISNRISQDEMIQKIYIISDMEFDACTCTNSVQRRNYYESRIAVKETLFQAIEKKYNDTGYKMPMLVFWNVSSRNDQFPMAMDERGFLNVSGSSPSIFTKLLKNQVGDAYSFMLETLDVPRYERIKYNG